FTTRAGARSRSSYALPKDSRPSPSTPRPATTHRPTEFVGRFRITPFALAGLLLILFSASGLFAQIPVAVPPPPPPGQEGGVSPSGGKIKVDVNLVVLHTTVVDDRGNFVDGLASDNFRVYEGKEEQKLSVFKREDIPVSMGLVIDNSGSMKEK